MQHIILSQDLDPQIHSDIVGSKALQLAKLKNTGFNVPDFFVIPSTVVQQNGINLDSRKEFRTIIKPQLLAFSFQLSALAVRSAALVEDGAEQSMAGQFTTHVDLQEHQIIDSLIDLIQDATNKLHGDLSKFSIIIQQYIQADISGVAFSRDPGGKRQMVINYHEGKGEDLVSGTIVPKTYEMYHYQRPKWIFAGIDDLVKAIKQIEELYDFPQDIERCVKDKQLYVLQTRPITTIKPEQFVTCTLIDQDVPHRGDFIFEKTEISEIAPKPSDTTLYLLKNIYSKDGPVDRVYQKYGIKYHNTGFLKLIQGELFVDREKEIKSLMPDYTYFGKTIGEPTLKWSRSMGATLKNIWRLGRISTDGYAEICQKIAKSFDKMVGVNSYDQAKQQFLTQYELVFEINLIAAKMLQDAKNMLSKESISFVELMSNASSFIASLDDGVKVDFEESQKDHFQLKQISTLYFDLHKIAGKRGNFGNTLDLQDTSTFVPVNASLERSESVQQRRKQLPTYKKPLYDKTLAKLGIWMHFRECARTIMIKYKSELMRISPNTDQPLFEKKCYLPAKITSYIDQQGGSIGVSSGIAVGKIVYEESINYSFRSKDPIILYVKNLSPALTEHFEEDEYRGAHDYHVVGIIAENGGLLSHMAIIAREYGIPVLITQELSSTNKTDKRIEIDGSAGTFTFIEKDEKNG